MWRGLRERLFGSADQDGVEQLSDELDRLKDHVLKHDTDRDRSLEHQVEQLEAHIDRLQDELAANRRALDHVVETLEHTADDDDRLQALEERLVALERQVVDNPSTDSRYLPEKEGVEEDERTSGRTSGRKAAGSGRHGAAVETAHDVERGKLLWEKATPAQRSILQTLYDAGYPMSYKEIAEEVGRSVSTVKNHINNLKSSGFDFKEDAGYNNTKKYLLDQRVKAFLTMRLND